MVVDQDDRGRPLRDCLPKDLAWVHERRIKDTTGDRDVAFQTMLRVQNGDVKLLDRQVLQTRCEDRHDVPGRPDGTRFVPAFRRHPSPELERRMDHDGPYAAD